MTQINEDACRRAFEEWAPTQGCSVDKWQHGDLTGYGFPAVHSMWLAFQAAWQAHTPKREAANRAMEPVSVEAAARAIRKAHYADLSEPTFSQLDNAGYVADAKACAEAWGLKWN